MMKRILPLLLALVLLVSALTIGVSAYAPLMSGGYGSDETVDVSLGAYTDDTLAAFPITSLLNLMDVTYSGPIAWVRQDSSHWYGSDEYTITSTDDTLDLRFASGEIRYTLTLVTGSRALGVTNKLYSVNIYNGVLSNCLVGDSSIPELRDSSLYNQSCSQATYSTSQGSGIEYDFTIYVPNAERPALDSYVVQYTTENITDYRVYEGNYSSAADAKANGVRIETALDHILTAKIGATYYCFVFEQNGQEVCKNVCFNIRYRIGDISISRIMNGTEQIKYNTYYRGGDNQNPVFTIPVDVDVNQKYALSLYYIDPEWHRSDDKIKHAWDAASNDVKEELFGDAGYVANYSGDGQTFRIIDEDETEYTVCVKLTASTESREDYYGDTHFQASTVIPDGETERVRNYLVMPHDADSLYASSDNCYQTILLKPESALDLSRIKPTFWVADGTQAFAKSVGEEAAVKQTSGESVVDFTTNPVQYTAVDARGTTIKNYWVSYVQKTDAPTLFVNGPSFEALQSGDVDDANKREVILTSENDYHDVFFANLGSSSLGGLHVSLDEEARKTLKIDDFWTAAGSDSFTAFEGTYRGWAGNISKIRLRLKDAPENLATTEISGVLTISSNAGNRYIYLTGSVNPTIVTESVPDGVKYVPYSVMIQTSNHSDSTTVTYSVSDGALPTGITLNENTGEIYGVPTQVGTYDFAITASFSAAGVEDSTKEYSIEIADNTDANVDASCDHAILDTVLDMGDPNDGWNGQYHDQVFRVDHSYGEFVKFFIDGTLLAEGTDYVSEEGSTKITVRSKTFERFKDGSHTIAVEFRTSENLMTKDAQNYKSTVPTSSGSSGSSKANKTDNAAETPDNGPFVDIRPSDWFYSNVMWAYEQGHMTGVSSSRFAPNQNTTQAMVVVVLARVAGVDLSKYADKSENLWYTAAADWAAEEGLIDPETFVPNAQIERGALAVMLLKFFDRQKITYTTPTAAEKVAFLDAGEMTAEEENAFQCLRRAGIFYGNGKNDMRPASATTRAHLAALLQRITGYMDAHKA